MKKSIDQKKFGVILTYFQIIASIVISMVTTPYITNTLGQAEYGLYTLVFSLVSYLNLFQLGIGSSYIRFYSLYKKEGKQRIRELNGTYLTVFCFLALLATLFGIFVMNNLELIFNDGIAQDQITLARQLIAVLLITTVVSFILSVFISYVTAHEQFVVHKMLSIGISVFRPIVMILMLVLGFRSLGMMLAALVVTLIVDICYVIFSFLALKFEFSLRKINKTLIKNIFSFSLFIALNSIVDQLNWNTGRILVTRYYGTAAVAFFSIALQLNIMYMELSTSISDVFVPMIHRMANENDSGSNFTSLMTKVGRLQFMIMSLALTGFILFGRVFINLWLGIEYDAAYEIILMLMIPTTIPMIQNIGIEMQRSVNKHKFRSVVYVIMAIANLTISIPLCKYFGIKGAAAGTSASLVVANGFIINWFYWKKMNIDIVSYWKNILFLTPVPLIMLVVGYFIQKVVVISSFLIFAIVAMFYSLVFVSLLYFIGMNESEKHLIKTILRKMKIMRTN